MGVGLPRALCLWLEFDNAYWAGTSAAIVCQPHLGATGDPSGQAFMLAVTLDANGQPEEGGAARS